MVALEMVALEIETFSLNDPSDGSKHLFLFKKIRTTLLHKWLYSINTVKALI